MNQTRLSVVIVNYNAGDYLHSCLRSLSLYGIEGMEIIVVDNHSTDGSIELAQKDFPAVKYIINTVNLGFPAANNQAFHVATGKYIFMLNPDAEVTAGALEQMFLFMEKHPNVALLSPRTVNQHGEMLRSVWKEPTLLSTVLDTWHLSFLQQRHYYQHTDFTTIFEVEAASGAAMFFRKEILDRIGELDENLFWIEDVDFCKRIRSAGYSILYFPHATVIHHVSVTAKKNYTISLSNQIFSKIKYFKKHGSILAALIVYFNSFLHVLAKLFWFGLQSPLNSIARKKTKAYWFTLTHLFNIPTRFSE